jgi:microcystin degradation protein MlrC
MRSALPPMALLLAQARALGAAHPGTDISLLGGSPYADTPHADAGVMVWSDDAATAQALAARMLDQLRERQRDFDVTLPSPVEGLARAIALIVDGISVIVTSAVVPANDPAFFEHHGIRLAETRLLCVKAKNHFRAAFAPRCAAIIEVDAPGPTMVELTRLPFVHWPGRAAPRV